MSNPPAEYTGQVMRMTRYRKPDEEIISLGDGQDPPAHQINLGYRKQTGDSRKCEECGKSHDTVWEDARTGERIEELSKCIDCLLFGMWVNEQA